MYSIVITIVAALLLGVLNELMVNVSPYFAYLIFPAMASIFVAWSSLSIKKASLLGFLFGIIYFGLSSRWLLDASSHFGVNDVVSNLFVVLIILSMSMTASLAAIIVSISGNYIHNPLVRVLGFGCAWFLGEWLRTWWFSGLPFFQIGYFIIDTPLAGYMAVVGSLGCGFIAALLSAIIGSYYRKPSYLLLSIIVFLVVMVSGWVLQKVEFTEYQKSISVRIIDGDISKNESQSSAVINKTIQQYLELSRETLAIDLVVWPESSIPKSFLYLYDQSLKEEFKQLSDSGTEVLFGTYVNELSDGLKKYNTALIGSNIEQKYFKQHRVPFGEYMPSFLSRFFPPSFLEDIDQYQGEPSLLEKNQMRIAPLICFELLFSHLSHHSASNLLVNISNFSWFNYQALVAKTVLIARARAIENGKFLLKSDNKGQSAIISHRGEVMVKSSEEGEAIDGHSQLRKGRTPYVVITNMPLLILSMIYLGCLILNVKAKIYRVRC